MLDDDEDLSPKLKEALGELTHRLEQFRLNIMDQLDSKTEVYSEDPSTISESVEGDITVYQNAGITTVAQFRSGAWV